MTRVVVPLLLAAAMLTGCTGTTEPTKQVDKVAAEPTADEAAQDVDPLNADARAYVDAHAAALCEIATSAYTDASEIEEVRQRHRAESGLDAETLEFLDIRLAADEVLNSELTAAVTATCGD